MKLEFLTQVLGLSCPSEQGSREITAITSDSRRVTQNALFVCICGLHRDGHDCIPEAIANGAACILTERPVSREGREDVIFLQCESTRRAEALLWNAWYDFPASHLKLIGVTGTNGKTTVTHMIRDILEASGHPAGLIGTVGCVAPGGEWIPSASLDPRANMTTPDPEILYRVLREMVKRNAEYAVMEVSSHALALDKVAPIRFAASVFTNLTPEHLDFHHTMEAYAAAKAKLAAQSALSVCNADSPYCSFYRSHATGRTLTCSAEGGNADFTAEEISENGGVRYRLDSSTTRLHLFCPIPGHFSVSNSMQAAIVALELGCSPAVIQSTLATLSPVKGRMERVKLGVGADFTVLIDYAHTPDALENLLRTSRKLCGRHGRLTLLFGCGGDRDASKRRVMGALAARLADRVILTSDNPRTEDPSAIIDEILSGMEQKPPAHIIPERREAIRCAVLEAESGEILLLSGKGHEEYEITKEGKRPFCEREIVQEAYAERLGIKRKPT